MTKLIKVRQSHSSVYYFSQFIPLPKTGLCFNALRMLRHSHVTRLHVRRMIFRVRLPSAKFNETPIVDGVSLHPALSSFHTKSTSGFYYRPIVASGFPRGVFYRFFYLIMLYSSYNQGCLRIKKSLNCF